MNKKCRQVIILPVIQQKLNMGYASARQSLGWLWLLLLYCPVRLQEWLGQRPSPTSPRRPEHIASPRLPVACKGKLYGPLENGCVPEESHHFPRAFPEVLQCVYVVCVPVWL